MSNGLLLGFTKESVDRRGPKIATPQASRLPTGTFRSAPPKVGFETMAELNAIFNISRENYPRWLRVMDEITDDSFIQLIASHNLTMLNCIRAELFPPRASWCAGPGGRVQAEFWKLWKTKLGAPVFKQLETVPAALLQAKHARRG